MPQSLNSLGLVGLVCECLQQSADIVIAFSGELVIALLLIGLCPGGKLLGLLEPILDDGVHYATGWEAAIKNITPYN